MARRPRVAGGRDVDDLLPMLDETTKVTRRRDPDNRVRTTIPVQFGAEMDVAILVRESPGSGRLTIALRAEKRRPNTTLKPE